MMVGEGKQKSETVGQKITHLSDRSCALFSSLFNLLLLRDRLDLRTKNYSVKSKLLDVGEKKLRWGLDTKNYLAGFTLPCVYV